MKWILIFLCLPVFGQLPVLPFAAPTTTSSTFEPTNYPFLFIYLATDRTTSLTNLVNGTTVAGWTNIAPPFSPGADRFVPSGATPMLFLKPGPTASIGAVDLSCTNCLGGSAGAVKFLASGTSYGTNQPITWHFVMWYPPIWDTNLSSGNKFSFITDTSSGGGREILQVDPNVNNLSMYAGSFVNGANNTFLNWSTWMVFTVVYNGASSAIYTNGVQYLTGNPGANNIGLLRLGTDQTDVVQAMGRLACVLAYGSNQPPATIAAIVSGLRSRFGI